jgi:hypothetical protein
MNFLGQPVSLASEKLTRFGSLLVKTGNFCFLAKKKRKKKKKRAQKQKY